MKNVLGSILLGAALTLSGCGMDQQQSVSDTKIVGGEEVPECLTKLRMLDSDMGQTLEASPFLDWNSVKKLGEAPAYAYQLLVICRQLSVHRVAHNFI